jgi:hypothetical protein
MADLFTPPIETDSTTTAAYLAWTSRRLSCFAPTENVMSVNEAAIPKNGHHPVPLVHRTPKGAVSNAPAPPPVWL